MNLLPRALTAKNVNVLATQRQEPDELTLDGSISHQDTVV